MDGFRQHGRTSGHSGCNDFGYRYQAISGQRCVDNLFKSVPPAIVDEVLAKLTPIFE
jgi:hypothetical protein